MLCNIDKIKSLAKTKGIKLKYICEKIGIRESYFGDIKSGKNKMTEERLRSIADLLGTTVEYLTDQTDDPNAPDDPQVGLLTKKALKEFEKLSDKDKETIVNLIESLSQTNGGK